MPNDHGARGEQYAAAYLQQKGYAILQRNFRVRGGELDIVAQTGDTLVFVEVKTRALSCRDTPAAAVTPQKQRRLLLAAQSYLQAHPAPDCWLRFDVVEVYTASPQRFDVARVEHICGAFEPAG